MGKKGADGGSGEASPDGEMEALKLRTQKIEDLFMEQSKEIKVEVASSQQSMKRELKEQLDEFFARLMKVQTSTPPPQPLSVESMASNIAQHAEQTPIFGDNSMAMPMFKLSASPQSQTHLPKTTVPTSYRGNTLRPTLPPQTPPCQPAHQSLHTLHEHTPT
jgi:hypothetical protein